MRRAAHALLLATVTVGLIHCSGDDGDAVCVSKIDLEAAQSPSAGKVTVPGEVDFEESVLIQYVYNGQSSVKTGESKNGVTTFSGLPTGTYEIIFILSCGVGVQEVQGSETIAVK